MKFAKNFAAKICRKSAAKICKKFALFFALFFAPVCAANDVLLSVVGDFDRYEFRSYVSLKFEPIKGEKILSHLVINGGACSVLESAKAQLLGVSGLIVRTNCDEIIMAEFTLGTQKYRWIAPANNAPSAYAPAK